MNGEHAEEWIPVSEALARVELYEHERRPILGIELAQMAPDENVLLPAFGDFSGCSEEEIWGPCAASTHRGTARRGDSRDIRRVVARFGGIPACWRRRGPGASDLSR